MLGISHDLQCEELLKRVALNVSVKIDLTFESLHMYYYRIADPQTA